jgi:hypothetical protein
MTTHRRAIDWSNRLDVFLDTAFREKGLGTWLWVRHTNEWSERKCIEFVNEKDQFIYLLNGGERWRKRIEHVWFSGEWRS